MDVAVDEARQDELAADVDRLGLLRDLDRRAGPAFRIFCPWISTTASGTGAPPLPSMRVAPTRAWIGPVLASGLAWAEAGTAPARASVTTAMRRNRNVFMIISLRGFTSSSA
jgi:hypothetical protein